MRTLLIQKAEDKFFYLNDDGTKTLVKNKVSKIYTLKEIKGKKVLNLYKFLIMLFFKT